MKKRGRYYDMYKTQMEGNQSAYRGEELAIVASSFCWQNVGDKGT